MREGRSTHTPRQYPTRLSQRVSASPRNAVSSAQGRPTTWLVPATGPQGPSRSSPSPAAPPAVHSHTQSTRGVMGTCGASLSLRVPQVLLPCLECPFHGRWVSKIAQDAQDHTGHPLFEMGGNSTYREGGAREEREKGEGEGGGEEGRGGGIERRAG